MTENKYGTEPRGKGFGWKCNIRTETGVRTIPTVY